MMSLFTRSFALTNWSFALPDGRAFSPPLPDRRLSFKPSAPLPPLELGLSDSCEAFLDPCGSIESFREEYGS